MKKFGFNSQMWNEPFFIVIYHSSLVNDTMNAARLCKLRNGVRKTPQFLHFQWPKVDQVRNEYLRSHKVRTYVRTLCPQLSKLMA
jgi:hypothetical protein